MTLADILSDENEDAAAVLRVLRWLDSAKGKKVKPHDNVSLPSTSDPQTVCADCGQVLEPWEVRICEPCGQNSEKSL